ncbi:MAG: hypothetical protein CM15mP47_1930 [Methanobacteriota archaeon]|nr:MAG: hypothetical protein CM15mP47_1930 [Euryarchaeota archaeon]
MLRYLLCIFGLAGGITVGVQNPEHNVTIRKIDSEAAKGNNPSDWI